MLAPGSSNGVHGAPNGHGLAAAGVDRKTMPHNLDAEASILGGILLRPDVMAELDTLEPRDFYHLPHQVVFTAMRNLRAVAQPIDVVTVEVEVEKQGRLDAIGGVAFLGELCTRVPSSDNVVHYSNIVQLASRNRRAIVSLASALERAKNWVHDPSELVLETAGELQRLEADRVDAYEAKKTRWCLPLGSFLGDTEPDDDDSEDWIIRDLIPRGEPMLWGGPMKGGKTWAALDLLIAIALGQSWLGFENTIGEPAPVLGIFLEDNRRRLAKRLWELCRARGTTPNNPLLQANLHLSRAPIRLPDAGHQRRLIAEIKAAGARFALMDNLTRVMIGDPNKTTDAAAFTRAWSEINDETACSTSFLHHTKKPSGDQTTADPFDQLRGSGDFGATARNIVVTTPIRTDSGDMLSEVRMRGNLDLRRDSFVMGFERKHLLERWHAKLVDRGEIADVKDSTKKLQKEQKEQKKREDLVAEKKRRCDLALEMARVHGKISQTELANALGLSSGRSVQPILDALVHDEKLVRAGKLGYSLPRAQGDFSV